MKKAISFIIAFSIATASVPMAMASTIAKETADIAVADVSVDNSGADEDRLNESYKTQLERAILSVKSKIEIPKNLTKFQSSVQKYGNSIAFDLSWYQDDNSSQSLNITTDVDGNIINYNYYSSDWFKDDNDKKLSKVTREEAKQFALDFIKKVSPNLVDKIVYDNDSSFIGTLSSSYNFDFRRVENGIPVIGDSVSVSVYNGSDNMLIEQYNVSWSSEAFPVYDNIIDEKSAQKAFRDNEYLQLQYRKVWSTDKVLLGYSQGKDATYIDANTGEFVKEEPVNMELSEDKLSGAGFSLNEASISDAEQVEIDMISSITSIDEIEKKIRSISELGIKDNQVIENYQIFKKDDDYMVRLTLRSSKEVSKDIQYTSVMINAKTLEIFNVNNDRFGVEPAENNNKLSEGQIKQAEKAIEDFLTKYSPTMKASIKYASTQNYEARVTTYYKRMVNDIPYIGDGISITFDTTTNKITSMYSSWDKIAENLTDVKNAISIDSAYDSLFNAIKLKKQYLVIGDTAKVVYYFSETPYIDAVTGKLTDYTGNAINNIKGNYNDISGHWAESIIKKLSDNGIMVSGESFKPDEGISQYDYLTLLQSIQSRNSYYRDSLDELYQNMINSGVISENEKNPDAIVTREDAVTYLLRVMGFKKAAEIKGIYICDFEDASDISEDKIGYAAIAKGLGLVNGMDNKFLPKKDTTRAEAAALLYNYLK